MLQLRKYGLNRLIFRLALGGFCVLQAVFAILPTQSVWAASAPNILNYQGRVLNANGIPVPDATASMVFELYTAAVAGTCVWSNSSSTCASATARTVTLTDGLFSESLGDTTASYAAISDSTFSDNGTLYLKVTVNGEALSPRKQLAAAPYAMNSDTLDGLDSDADCSTAAALVALTSAGNVIFTGDPTGSTVSTGVAYINPAAAGANETLLGIADNGTERFRLDKEGDVFVNGDLAVNGGDLTSSSGTFNLLDATGDSTTIDIGGVTTNLANTINIATNTTSADTINIGNANAGTVLALTGGDDWSVTAGGFGTFSDLSCVDCLDFDSLDDTMSLDAFTFILGGAGEELVIDRTLTNAVSEVGFTVQATGSDTTSSTLFQHAMRITNRPSSEAVDSLILMDSTDADDAVNRGIWMTSDTGGINTAIDISDTDIGTGIDFGSNDLVGLTPLINFSNFDVATTGAITVAPGVGLDVNSGGALIVGNTNATSLSMCNSLSCDTVSIATNTDADVISLGDNSDTVNTDARMVMVNDTLTTETNLTLQSHGLSTGHVMTLASSGNALTTGDLFSVLNAGTRTATGTISASVADLQRTVINNSGGLLTLSGDLLSIDNNPTNSSGTLVDTANLISLNQQYSSASGAVIDITNQGTGAALKILQAGSTGTTLDSSVGGSLHISDTANDDYSFTIYNNTGASANTPLAYILQDHIGFDQDILRLQNDSNTTTSSGLVITQNVVADATTAATSQGLVINVNESQNSEEVILIVSDADGTPDAEFRFENDGDLFGDGAAYNSGADYAEFFYTVDGSLGDHDLVCQDLANNLAVKKCGLSDGAVIGVVSTKPGFVGNNIPGADGSLEGNPNYRVVGLEGQIETHVTAADGAIAVGDALTASAITAGYAGKANSAGRVVGFAMEPMAAGSGLITVRVSPGWDAGEILADDGDLTSVGSLLALESLATATAAAPASDSHGLAFRGSAWDGSAAQTVAMTLSNKVTSSSSYRLSVANNSGAEVAYINNLGDLVLSGKLYPSNQGTAQTSAYVYYDSQGVGYMRTNAAGWGTGSYDFAEMFPSPESLSPGDVVVFGDGTEQVKRSTGEKYDDRIAGVVSTRPGFLAGTYKPGDQPIALSGRVPTRVNIENGTIAIGDPLTTSSVPGVAMKATEAGPIVGYAMQPFAEGTGMITVFIRASYYDGGEATPALAAAPVSAVTSSGDLSSLSLNGGAITSVGSIAGIGNVWSLGENGDLITHGRVVQVVKSYQNENVDTFPVMAREQTLQLSGTATLNNNTAEVKFEDIDPKFNDIMSVDSTYRVLATPAGLTGQIYVTDRTTLGFTVHAENAADGTLVDWLVIAPHKDYAPVTPVVAGENVEVEDVNEPAAEVEEVVEPGDVQAPPTTAGVGGGAGEEIETPSQIEPEPVLEEPAPEPEVIP